MSNKAMQWAMYEAPTDLDPIEFKLLMIIADNVDSDGRGFGKSIDTIIELFRTPISRRTIIDRLGRLRAKGVIRYGDQRLLAYLPANRRPKVYDLAIDTTTEPEPITPNTASNATDTESRGAAYAPQNDDNDPTADPTPARGAADVQQGCSRGAAGVHAYVHTNQHESYESLESRESTRARNKTTTDTSADGSGDVEDPVTRLLALTPDPTHLQIAAQTGQDAAYELAKYQDACLANGRIPQNPAAGFRNWLRRATNHPTTTPAAPTPTPATPMTRDQQLNASTDRILANSTILGSLLPTPEARAQWRPSLKQALADGLAPAEAVDMVASAIRLDREPDLPGEDF